MEDFKNKVTFTSEDNEETDFYVLEQTKLNGITYLLVTETEEDDEEEGTAYILKDMSSEEDESSLYTFIEDEEELDLVAKIFEELLEDTDIEL
ncbi:MAG: hypothetical protein K0S61_1501 [Anaerocolumna sp.]|jgi:uncharacterized protein YrzB (UPF0473 family)|nr:hypothetical protein [Anaerocolumna sp.]